MLFQQSQKRKVWWEKWEAHWSGCRGSLFVKDFWKNLSFKMPKCNLQWGNKRWHIVITNDIILNMKKQQENMTEVWLFWICWFKKKKNSSLIFHSFCVVKMQPFTQKCWLISAEATEVIFRLLHYCHTQQLSEHRLSPQWHRTRLSVSQLFPPSQSQNVLGEIVVDMSVCPLSSVYFRDILKKEENKHCEAWRLCCDGQVNKLYYVLYLDMFIFQGVRIQICFICDF